MGRRIDARDYFMIIASIILTFVNMITLLSGSILTLIFGAIALILSLIVFGTHYSHFISEARYIRKVRKDVLPSDIERAMGLLDSVPTYGGQVGVEVPLIQESIKQNIQNAIRNIVKEENSVAPQKTIEDTQHIKVEESNKKFNNLISNLDI